jgi:prepilin-type N-terminal cleavage/methylation domain-containing protein
VPHRFVSEKKGLSLIEVVVAITILSVVVLALGSLMFQIARHARASAGVAYRSAALESAASWLEGLPWDSMPSAVGCTDSLTVGLLEYTRCVDLLTNTPRHRVARITITPTGDLRPSADTIMVERTTTRSESPFGFE